MNLNLTNGSIGQIQGPLTSADTINFNKSFVKLGISLGENDLMTYQESENKSLMFQIDNELIRLGQDGIYETDDVVQINQLTFPQGAPASLLIEYVINNE